MRAHLDLTRASTMNLRLVSAIGWTCASARALTLGLAQAGPPASGPASGSASGSANTPARARDVGAQPAIDVSRPEPAAPRERPEAGGFVVLVAGVWAFDADEARTLCADPTRRVGLALAPRAPNDVDPFAGTGTPTPFVTLDMQREDPGGDEVAAERVRRARCIVLDRGSWLGWWRVLDPDHKVTSLGRALREAHEDGATIVAIDAAAAYVSGWSLVSREQIRRPARDPHDLVPDVISTSFALAPSHGTDLAIDGRATPGPLVDRLANSSVDLGVWLEGDVAWIEDPRERTARVVAPKGRAFVFDLSAGRRTRGGVRDARFTAVEHGARFDLRANVLERPGAAREAWGFCALPDSESQATCDLAIGLLTLRRDAPAAPADGSRPTPRSTGRFDWEPTARGR